MSGVQLYPQLEEDKATPVDNFRLAHITEEIKFLERELSLYSKCRRRYSFVLTMHSIMSIQPVQ